MNSIRPSRRIINKKNREEFIKLLTREIPTPNYHPDQKNGSYLISGPIHPETIRGKLRQYAEQRWNPQQLVWKKLYGQTTSTILEITTTLGKCIIMRDGNNLGPYNFIVLDPQNEIHFCQNCVEACDLVDIIGSDIHKIPLLMGTLNSRLLPALEKRLKGDNSCPHVSA
jgi:hypothetical protein